MPEPLRLAFLGAASSRACTAGICGRSAARSSRATPAATGTRPRRSAASSAALRATATTRRRSPIRAIDAVVVAVPPRFHLELTLQALPAGKHVLVEKPAFLRLEDYRAVLAARDARGARRAGRRERPLQAARRPAAAAAGRRRHRRDGVRALHDHRAAAEERGRLAQRRGDGRRRRVLRGRHPLAAHRRQPRPAHRRDPRLPAGGVARRARTGAPRA